MQLPNIIETMLNMISKLKAYCEICCNKMYRDERKTLTCGQGVFADQILLKKEVDFVLPPSPFVETNTSCVQKYSSTPDWKNGSSNPEKALRYLVQDHRKASYDVLTESHLEPEQSFQNGCCLKNNQR